MATANAQIIRCPKCGAQNRVAAGAEGSPVCGRCKTPLTGEAGPVIFSDLNFAAEVERSPLPVLVDFWAPWCGPCRMVGPIVDQLAKEFSGKARLGKLNVDDNQTTAARFNVQSIPTLLIFKGGREVDRIVGAQSKEALSRRLEQFI